MQRVIFLCIVVGLVGCAKEPAAAVKPAAAKPSAVKPLAVEPPPTYDEDKPVARPRPRLAALEKEVDAYLAEPPIAVTATELVKAYQNEAAADERFKDRKVWVTGYVLRTGRGTLGTPYVELDPGKTEGGAVRCFFERGRTLTVEELKENQEVTIEGRVFAKTGNEVRVNDARVLTPAFMQSVKAAARDQKANRE